MAQEKINKTCAFIIGSVVFVIITGLLIYLCLYLTRYTPPNNTNTLTSSTNHSRITLFNSTTLLKIVANALHDNDDDDDDIISHPDATIPVLKKVMVTTLKKTPVPSLTRVTVPSTIKTIELEKIKV